MKKRILSILLTLVMVIGMIPATSLTAFAAAGGKVYVGDVCMYDGDYLAVGATATQTTKPSGGYAYYEDGTLTLNNYSYEGEGYLHFSEYGYYATVFADNDLTLELVGTNTLTQTEEKSNVIYVRGADLTVDGNGKLIGTADDGKGLEADGDLTINGGTIAVTTYYKGISGYGKVSINGGDIIAESKGAACIYGGNGVTINCGNVTAIGDTKAIAPSDSFSVAKNLNIRASTTADGNLGEYVAANHDSYKKIVVGPDVYVGGVGMYDGDYLAVGATEAQTTKPSGGYAYYKDGTLALNNYSYTGVGCQESHGFMTLIYSMTKLTVHLVGSNYLTAVSSTDEIMGICADTGLTINADSGASLTIDCGYIGIYVQEGSLVFNGGDINVSGDREGIFCYDGDITINDGDITATGATGIISNKNVIVNGSYVEAIAIDTAYDDARNAISIPYDGVFSVADWCTVLASTTADGELGEYTAARLNTYKKVVITLKPEFITNVNVSATFSGTPADATTSTTGAAVTATKWYKKNGSSWTELGASDTIKEGGSYRCEVTVAATGDYVLADGYTVKINGTAATKKSGNTWYVDKTIAGILPLIDVMDIYLPEAGITPDFTCTWDDYSYDDEIYEVEKIEWFKSNASGSILSDALPADYVFEEDSYYLLKVTIKPKDGWILHQTGFYINGKKVENDGESGTIGKIVYHTDDAYSKYTVKIDDVTMKDGDYLAWGASAVTATKPSDRYAYYNDGVLTLNNWNDGQKYPTENGVIEFNQRHLKINLVGENYIETIKDKHDVYGYDEDGPYWLTIEGNGSLYLEGYATNCTIAVDGTVSFNGGYIEIDASLWGVSKVERIEINGADVYFTTGQDGFSVDDSVNMVVYDGTFRAFDAGSYAGDEWLNINFMDESAYRVYAGSSTGISNPREVQPDQLEVWTGTDFTSFDSYDLVMASVVSTHTVTFKVDTTTVATKTVEDGKTVTAPADPTQSGKTFLGWYTDGGTKFDFTTPITGDITLTAKFEDAASTPEGAYRINSITVRNTSGTELTSIPKGQFLATVSITKLNGNNDALVMLAGYTSQGQYQGMMWVSVEDVPVGATIKVTLPVDNSDGKIANLKAFAVGSFDSFVPLGNSVSFLP